MNYLDEAVTKSLDEFMEYYKVVDTENIYSIGIEFVPIFRVKQWEEYNNKDKEIERLNKARKFDIEYNKHLQKEIIRLNNIINELEKYINEEYIYDELGMKIFDASKLQDKLQELKGSDNNK